MARLQAQLRPPVQILPLNVHHWDAGVLFSPDGQWLAVVDGLNSAGLRVFDTANWQDVSGLLKAGGLIQKTEHGSTSTGPAIDVPAIAFRADGRRVAVLNVPANLGIGAGDQQIRVWDVTERREIVSLLLPKQNGAEIPTVSRVAFSPDGSNVVAYVARPVEQLIVWDAVTGKERSRFPLDTHRPFGRQGIAEAVAFSADGRTFGLAAEVGAQFWDTATGKPKHVARINPNTAFAFTPDLGLLAGIKDDDTSIYVWNTTTGSEVSRLGPPSGFLRLQHPHNLAFSPDGRFLAEGSQQNAIPQLVVWDLAGERVLVHLRALHGAITSLAAGAGLAWHPDGRLLAVATGREVRIFDIAVLAADD